MIRSMTGFASKNISITLPDEIKSQLTITLKSLNSRYFEVSCRMPYPLNSFETDIIKLLKPLLLRGHIYCTIYVSNPESFKGTIIPALNTIEQYVSAARTVMNTFQVPGPVTLDTLFQLPNVFNTTEQTIDTPLKQELLKAITSVAKLLIEHEQKEGQALKKDILSRIDLIRSNIEQVKEQSNRITQECKKKVHTTLAELTDDDSKFAEIKKNSLYVLLDKIDIHEEIVRFKNHLDNLTNSLQSTNTEKGKRIDFTLQELSREINTIAAKSPDSTISSAAINIKVEIEKAREQAQNIV
jgi:uncharacterized protein (TIGR00255 family)